MPDSPASLQGAAVEAAARLDEALAQPRCSSAALKTVLLKAEAAAAAAAPGTCQFAVGAELLVPRIQVTHGWGGHVKLCGLLFQCSMVVWVDFVGMPPACRVQWLTQIGSPTACTLLPLRNATTPAGSQAQAASAADS